MSDRTRATTTPQQNDLILRQDDLRALYSLVHSPPLKLQTSAFGTVVRVRVGTKRHRATSFYGTDNTDNTDNPLLVAKFLSSRYRRLDCVGAGEDTGPKKVPKGDDTQQKCAVEVSCL
jgi:hypothetical protein